MDESLIREQEAQLQKTGRYYKHICFMAVPVLWMACFLYGVRPLLLCGIAVLTGNLCDRFVSLLRRRVYQAGDFSNESFALVIALLMPVCARCYSSLRSACNRPILKHCRRLTAPRIWHCFFHGCVA